MARRKKTIDKEAYKKRAGKCKFCPCDIYELLDVHRILEGANGGKYEEIPGMASNVVTACANCHRKIHTGTIRIDRWYPSSSGALILHYWQDGVEHWE